MDHNFVLKAGYAEQVVTPPLGEKIPGYFKTRYAEGKHTELLIRAVAFDDGESRAVIFSCDAISIEHAAYRVIADKFSELFGLDPKKVYLHATHTHTAFRIMMPTDNDPVYADFFPHLIRMFCDVCKYALDDLKPCTFKIARGEAKGISFNRRYEKKDGSYKTNPKTGDPELLRRAGPEDESVQLLRILREGGKEILMINFGTHPDTVTGNYYNYDWPGYTVDYLRGAFGDQIHALLMNGAQGDVNHCDRFLPEGTVLSGPWVPKKMARVLAGEVLKIYDLAEDVPTGKLYGYQEQIKIGKNAYDPANVPLAQEIYDHYQVSLKTGERDEFLKDADKRRIPHENNRAMTIPEACRIIQNLSRPEFFELTISGLQIGSIGFIGIPGEPFTRIGMDIKNGSELKMTFVDCLVNGGAGYYPTADAFAVNGYESCSSPFASNCAELIINAGKKITLEMAKNK
ncbi:MAG: neutral/alkaline non-lysosomal ceramidase N-terminal domain-containing protein [Clostridia bacterium]|nr:neutral/alkaline non-lysosomal ceramidase N-terminal domain-containing protein [Clostridia bacterium]